MGHVMLFDVTAVESREAATSQPIQVRFPEESSDPEGSGFARSLTPIVLTRFAAQQLYAPQRVLREPPGVRRIPMGTPEEVSLYRGENVVAHPLASWQGGGLYVTALKMTNLGTTRISLDPRMLKGHFVSATFQHNTLGVAKSLSDTTCVYVVTDRPFMASLFSVPARDDTRARYED
jgi:integrating conjugative element protein (TIGR03749 family)